MKPWKFSTKSTVASRAHVELGQQTFTDDGGGVWGFWSLAARRDFGLSARKTKDSSRAHDFVWLVSNQTLSKAVVNTETGEVLKVNAAAVDYDYRSAA